MIDLLMQAGWLSDVTSWLVEQIHKVWDAFALYMKVLFLVWVKEGFEMAVTIIGLIPAPDFLNAQTIGSMLGDAGPQIMWFVTVFQVPASSAVIASAAVFFFARRVLTLGIW